MKTCKLEPLYEINLQNRYSSDFHYEIDNVPHMHDNNGEVGGPYLHNIKATTFAPIKNSVSSNTCPATSDIEYHDTNALTMPYNNPTLTQTIGLAYNPEHFGVDSNGLLYIKRDFFTSTLSVVNGTITFPSNGYSITNNTNGTSTGVFPTNECINIIANNKDPEGKIFDYWTVDVVNNAPINLRGAISNATTNASTFIMPFNNPMVQMLPVQCTANFKWKTYTVYSECDAGGSITPLGNVIKIWGQSQTYVVQAATNNHIKQIVIDGINVFPADQIDNNFTTYTYTFLNIKEDGHSICVMFAINAYTVTFTLNNSTCAIWQDGTTADKHVFNVPYNSSVAEYVPTVNTNNCCVFIGWNRILTNIVSDTTIAILTAAKQHTVKYVVAANGYVVGNATQYLACGQTTTPIIATPTNNAWKFGAWDDGYPTAARTDTASIVGDMIKTATMVPNMVTLTVINGSGSGIYQTGTTVQINYSGDPVDDCNTFANWKVDAGDVAVNNIYNRSTTVIIGTVSSQLSINLTAKTHPIYIYDQVGRANPEIIYIAQNTQIALADPIVPIGQTFDKWVATAGTISGNTYTTICATANIRPMFTNITTYSVTVVGGVITGTANTTANYPANTIVSITATVANFNNWTMTPQPNTATCSNYNGNVTTIITGAQAVVMTANSVEPKYILSVNNGTGSGNYYAGEQIAISTSSSDPSKQWSNWIEDAPSSNSTTRFQNSNAQQTTYTMPASNATIHAIYTTKILTVAYTCADNNCNINGSSTNSQQVSYGSTTTPILVSFSSGYKAATPLWSDGNNTNPRIDSNVTANATYTASSVIIPQTAYTLTVNNGVIQATNQSTGIFETDTLINIIATVPTDYMFDNWTDSANALITDNNITPGIVKMPAANIAITANNILEIAELDWLLYWQVSLPSNVYSAAALNGLMISPTGATGAIRCWTRTFDADVHYSYAQSGNDSSDFFASTVARSISYKVLYEDDSIVSGTYNIPTYNTSTTSPTSMTFKSQTVSIPDVPSVKCYINANSGTQLYSFVLYVDANYINQDNPEKKILLNVGSENAPVANFPYIVTFNVDATKGTLAGSKTQYIQPNKNASTVTVTANDGYVFSKWVCGSKIITTPAITLTALAADEAWVAVFTDAATYTVNFNVAVNGVIDTTGTIGYISAGTNPQTIIAGQNCTKVTAKNKNTSAYKFGRATNPKVIWTCTTGQTSGTSSTSSTAAVTAKNITCDQTWTANIMTK